MAELRRYSPRGAVGKADLLRLLQVSPRETLIVLPGAEGRQDSLAYVCSSNESVPLPMPTRSLREPDLELAPQAALTERQRSLQMEYVYAVVRQAIEAPAPETAVPARPVVSIEESHAQPRSQGELQAHYEDLVPTARLLPALQRWLSMEVEGRLDIAKLARSIAMNQLPRRLPRRRRRRWHPQLVVVLDFSWRLWPYREDMHRLAERLQRRCGRSGVALRIFNEGAAGGWYDWQAEQQEATRGRWRAWHTPPAGTPVLVASDLGLLLGSSSAAAREWLGFVQQLRTAGLRVMALSPVSAEQIAAEFARAVSILRWSPDARLVAARGVAEPARVPNPQALQRLLALLSVTRRVDPPLLRALRQRLDDAPTDASLEGAVWCHQDVDSGTTCAIRSARLGPHQALFASDPQLIDRHVELNELRMRHHAHLRRALEHEEVLLWAAHASRVAGTLATDAQQQAVGFIQQLAHTLKDAALSESLRSRWREVAEGMLARAEGDLTLTRAFGEVLWLLKHALARVGATDEWLPLGIVHDIESNSLRLQTLPAGDGQQCMAGPIEVGRWGMWVNRAAGDQLETKMVTRHQLPHLLTNLEQRNGLCVETRAARYLIVPIERPRGIESWSCGDGKVFLQGPALCGDAFVLALNSDAMPVVRDDATSAAPERWYLRCDALTPATPDQPVFGLDTNGLYMDLLIRGRSGSAVQRFRSIEAGTFLMGSPADEVDRYGDEGPQHWVTLSRGFWLADTVCTQALWQAVMGENSSHFKGDAELPMECVSWDDVQEFSKKLQGALRGYEVSLPTEAQWEYACRAGTKTPFSFGSTITPAQVNYNARYPYGRAEEGEDRERTVPVKSLAPNAWGLYQMHGNVHEWCLDGFREYAAEPVVDPMGPMEEGVHRAFRGGSWHDDAVDARSAFRARSGPGTRRRYLGFRLCLRLSVESGLRHA